MNHAILSPSGSDKWSNCPASIQLEAQARSENPGSNTSNIHADTGTLAHMMAEICLTYDVTPDRQFIDMQSNVQKYLDYVAALKSPYSHHWVEERVEIFDGCWGTSDLIIRDRDELHIIDLKYGKGIVQANNNSQMILYAYGMIKSEEMDTVDNITLHIVMPRGKNSSWTITRAELLARGKELEIKGKAALDPDNLETNPSDKTCQWCSAMWICPAQLDKRTKDFDVEP